MPIVLRIHNVHHHLLTLCTYNSYTCNLCFSLCAEDFPLRLGLRFEVLIVLRIHNVHYLQIYIHIILKVVICFAICVLKMFTLWPGLRFDMSIVLVMHNVVHHHLLTMYI